MLPLTVFQERCVSLPDALALQRPRSKWRDRECGIANGTCMFPMYRVTSRILAFSYLEPGDVRLHRRDCVRRLLGKERCARRAGLPGQTTRRCPRGFLTQPQSGGPPLAHHSVSRQSLCDGMAPSSFAIKNASRSAKLGVLSQNRLSHGGAI